MRLIERVLGSRADQAFGERLHQLEHAGKLDRLMVRSAEIQRRRFKATTERGEVIALALTRDHGLFDGAVLVCEPDHALVVRVPQPRWLRLVPRDVDAALELAYQAGNLHWRVKFDGAALLVAQEGPADAYRARLSRLLAADAITADWPDDPC